ncbi:MAG: S49 family peptidase [Micavibrio sp.]
MSDPFSEKANNEDSALNLAALVGLPVIGPLIRKLLKRGPKIPVLRLSGIIADSTMKRGGLSYARLSKLIDQAFSIPKIPAVVLVINSPGGAPAQSQLIASLIRAKAEEKNVTVIAFVEDVAASGGYWLACAADDIFVQDTSIVGSIGVISASFGLENFIDKHGIKRRLYTSGREKSMLDPFLPEKPADIARLKEIQHQIHTHFIDWVKDRRGGKLNGTDEELFEGRFWTGSAALDMGIADALGSVHITMQEKYGADVRFIEFSPDKKFPGLLSLLPRGKIGPENWADDLIDSVEDRTIWARFGF